MNRLSHYGSQSHKRSRLPYIGVGLVDQAFSSVSNTGIVFAVARVSEVRSFGSISFALAAVFTTLAISRGTLGVPISLFGDRPEKLGGETNHALAVAGSIGLVVSLLSIPLGLTAGGPAMAAALCLASPAVLMQDVCRFYVVAASRPWVAVMADGLWACSTLLLLLTTFAPHPPFNSLALVVGWSMSAGLSLILIMSVGRVFPRVRGTLVWLRESSFHRVRFGLDAAAGATGSFVLVGLAGVWLGAEAIAALRGAATVLGPIAVLISATQLSVVPELRRRNLSVDALWSRLWRIALPMSSISLTIGIASMLVPATWGEIILGNSWGVVRGLLPITGAEYGAVCWIAAISAGLTVRGRSGARLRLGIGLVALSAIGVIFGALVLSSVVAVAAGLFVSAVVASVGGLWALLHDPGRTGTSGADACEDLTPTSVSMPDAATHDFDGSPGA